MAEQLAENQRMVEEQTRPWEERLSESDMRFAEANREQRERADKIVNTPHLTNLNEDPQLSGMVTYFLEGEPGETGEIPITCVNPTIIDSAIPFFLPIEASFTLPPVGAEA
jgi:hypothetical protein